MKKILRNPVELIKQFGFLNLSLPLARGAELVDAADSKSAAGNGVSVRFRSRAQD